jgi:ABC-type Fe3+/spermidine/putrescine transport system ATPase subunit
MAFLGRANFVATRIGSQGWRAGVETPLGTRLHAQPADPSRTPAPGVTAQLAIRPEHVQVRSSEPDAARGEFSAKVGDLIYRGALAEVLLHVQPPGAGSPPIILSADLPADGLTVGRGDTVAVRLPDEHCLIFEENAA